MSTTMTTSSEEREMLLCRRVTQDGVVVATLHPTLGPLYWMYYSSESCFGNTCFGNSLFYGTTSEYHAATVFKSGYYHGQSFQSFQEKCLSDLTEACTADLRQEGDCTNADCMTYPQWVETLASLADCTPAELVEWLKNSVWVEYPAPVKISFLSDFDGFTGHAVWANDVEYALEWHPESLEKRKSDPDVAMATCVGDFVPASEAMNIPGMPVKPSGINHALEADCMLSLHRLGYSLLTPLTLHRTCNHLPSDSMEALSSRGDLRESAWIHAARAGLEYVSSGENMPVSEHITRNPELLSRFNVAADLSRHFSRK